MPVKGFLVRHYRRSSDAGLSWDAIQRVSPAGHAFVMPVGLTYAGGFLLAFQGVEGGGASNVYVRQGL